MHFLETLKKLMRKIIFGYPEKPGGNGRLLILEEIVEDINSFKTIEEGRINKLTINDLDLLARLLGVERKEFIVDREIIIEIIFKEVERRRVAKREGMEAYAKAKRNKMISYPDDESGGFLTFLRENKSYRIKRNPIPHSERYWTVYGENGFEDFDLSMLHIYFRQEDIPEIMKLKEV